MVLLADALAAQGHAVSIVTLADAATDFFKPSPDIRRIGLNQQADSTSLPQAVANNLRRARALRTCLRELCPEVLIAFGDQANVLALLASRGLPCRAIVSERNDPARHAIGRLWSGLRRLAYPWADVVVVQTAGVQDWMRRTIPKARPVVIPNPVPPPTVTARPGERRPTVIGVGRLFLQKGFDRLIEAFATVAPDFPEWRLKLVGDGPLRDELAALAETLGVAEKVEFTGRSPHPEAHLAEAGLFVLPSRYEGFPNALLEAMALGLPVVAFDCPSGPSAIITHGVDGLLVAADDVAALADSMARLMADRDERHRLGKSAVSVLDRFGIAAVLAEWERLIDGVRR